MSPLFDDGSGRAPRVPLLGAFLVMTVVLAVWLGYEAVAAYGSQRKTAESVLRDYADISLESYVATADHEIGVFLDQAFDDTYRELRFFWRLPNPIEIWRELDDAAREASCSDECPAIESPRVVFSADLRTGETRFAPDSVSAARVREIAREVVARRPDVARYGDGFLTVPAGRHFPEASTIGYGVAKDTLGNARVMGFVAPLDGLEQLFAEWYRDRRLLPEPIGRDLPNDSLLQVTVRAPDSSVVYASPVEYPTTLMASRSLGPENGDMTVEVAIRPDQASQLIIGGLPNSRLPLLLTLLLLTLAVGGAALVQFRQEARFQRLRDDFVSGVSHELRTPLAQIRMFAELQDLGKLSSPEDRQRANAVIHREARRLSHLVDNILQFSRLRYAGGPDMPKEALDFADAVDEGVDAMSTFLRDRAMSLRVQAEPGLRVRANRDALTRIVVNLLDNAAKYGPEGQEVTVDVRRSGSSARLSVQDEGPGVPPADREKVFKAYRRLERDVKARLPGSGIGLSVVSELVSAHGGRVWVEDGESGGARFVVDLPLTHEARAALDGAGGPGSDGGLDRVVDIREVRAGGGSAAGPREGRDASSGGEGGDAGSPRRAGRSGIVAGAE